MSYLVISAKEVIKTHRPLLYKSVKEIQDEISDILVTSENLLTTAKKKYVSDEELLNTQKTISEVREKVSVCMNELYFRN